MKHSSIETVLVWIRVREEMMISQKDKSLRRLTDGEEEKESEG